MVVEWTPINYRMGCSDPFPAGYEIKFGGFLFQATSNGYHMRIIGGRPVLGGPAARPKPQETPPLPVTPKRRRRSGARAKRARATRRARDLADTFAEVKIDDPP